MTKSFFSKKTHSGEVKEFREALEEASNVFQATEAIFYFLQDLIKKNIIYFNSPETSETKAETSPSHVERKTTLQEMDRLEAEIKSQKKFLQTIYSNSKDNLNNEKELSERRSTLETLQNSLSTLKFDLLNIEVKIRYYIAPETLDESHPAYNQSIKRICYRGDSRPPYSRDKKGVFEIGFSKKLFVDPRYEFINKRKKLDKNPNKIIGPFSSNPASAIALSKFPESAVLFPLEFGDFKLLHAQDMINILSDLLNIIVKKNQEQKLQIKIIDLNKLIKEEINNMANTEIKTILKTMVTQNTAIGDRTNFDFFSYFLQDILAKSYDNTLAELLINRMIALLPKLIPLTNQSWLYVVYVERGCDVTSSGYRHALNEEKHFKKFNPEHANLMFAFEICAEEIPPEHVLAVFAVSRNFEKLEVENRHYKGEAKFKLEKIQYNPIALQHFNKIGIDVKKYQKILENYMRQNRAQDGLRIHISADGYQRNEHFKTPKRKPPKLA